ncbi:hypothetical protein Pmani_017460 [Petrolisthes manimaculis]|uniref:Uncharacterized protein n=1 Tax=Petrolisthes manimaculis TaxID=1843537 RepID=A0AAE1PNC9_9EUCA|nr:hypothetical protein Pmani_017460 [Petrolisthes manimaculis]
MSGPVGTLRAWLPPRLFPRSTTNDEPFETKRRCFGSTVGPILCLGKKTLGGLCGRPPGREVWPALTLVSHHYLAILSTSDDGGDPGVLLPPSCPPSPTVFRAGSQTESKAVEYNTRTLDLDSHLIPILA